MAIFCSLIFGSIVLHHDEYKLTSATWRSAGHRGTTSNYDSNAQATPEYDGQINIVTPEHDVHCPGMFFRDDASLHRPRRTTCRSEGCCSCKKKNNGVVLSGQGVLALFVFIRIVVKTFVVDANMA